MESQGEMNTVSSLEDNQRWAAVYQSVARRMLSFVDHSEASKVDTKELEDHVLAPNEPRVDIDHKVR